MIVGKIDFNNPDRRFRFDVNWANYRDCLYDYAFEKKHVVLVCRQCGQMLAPFVELAGPRACGWRKAGKVFYCHQCTCHNGGLWDGSEEDKELFEEEVKKRNDKTKRLILRYQFYHPWVRRIRYK